MVWVRHGRTAQQTCTSMLDDVTVFTIARETTSRLETLTRRAKEGKDLHAAKEFASYLRWSGVLKLLEGHTATGPLKVDGALIRWKNEQLIAAVNEQFKGNSVIVPLELSALESINHKLDLLAGRLSAVTTPTAEPVFRVA